MLIFIFIFSTLASLYEGSEILNKPWDWKNTAIFSQLANGEVKNTSQVLFWDYFIYAAKFLPFYPICMLISFFLIFFLLILRIKNVSLKISFLILFSFISIGIMFFLSNSPTPGLYLTSIILGIIGTFCILTTFFICRRKKFV
ncbi:DUF4306 domain-containing protein [Sporosarcina sp. NCCP-2716]|uniref:DUF4306 domain-containing protein n=1 Tax=Sporosarcina sp. NCCP-2716 TaxID=2943679 RepID=UPI0037D9B6F2